jgi:hypothetical protein
MTYEEEVVFLQAIRNYCTTPGQSGKVIGAALAGVHEELERQRAHAVDMETVASVSLNARMYKGSKKFIANLLEKHSGMNALKWDEQIKELRK